VDVPEVTAAAVVLPHENDADAGDRQTGEVLAIGLITLGLGAALLLVFLEVGLSEERELAREEKRRQELDTDGKRRFRPGRWPRRPA
jgi:hypothetical protein